MFLSLDVLPLETASTPLQAVDNNVFSPDSTELEATFAEVMNTPLLVGDAEFTGVFGEELPVGGNSLPVPVNPELPRDVALQPGLEDIEQPIAPVAEILTTSEVAGEAIEVQTSVVPNPSLAELDEARPASIADAANIRTAEIEKPTGIHNLRADADPFVRQATTTDRLALPRAETPVAVQGNELDLAQKNEQLTTQARPVVFATENGAPRLPHRPIPEVTTSAIPVPSGGVENLEAIQKPTLAPVSGAPSAAAIQAPPTPQLAASAPKVPAVIATTIDVPVFDENWGNALQDRVMWMTTRNIQNAEIRLNPAELGPIRVQVSVQDDAAQLTFAAQHAQTRDALEVAMPRLREMLSENGLSLGDATVTDGDSGDVHKDSQAEEYSGSDAAAADQDDVADNAVTPLRQTSSSALLDTFV